MSNLGAQLKAFAAAPGRDTSTTVNRAHTYASLLFDDPTKAANVSVDAIFSLAHTGLLELSEMNGAVLAFQKTLFSEESIKTDRELQTREFNDKLNESISVFLQYLSPYVLLPPASSVLEYLIRRYKIHIYNVDDVIKAILPFHETAIFVRMLRLMKLDKTRWEFLNGVKNSGAAAPREVLAQRCTHDKAFLEAICDLTTSGTKFLNSRTHVTFSCVTIMETLSALSTITKDFVNRILPFILRAFENGVPDEYRVGGLTIVGVLASKASLSRGLCSTLLEAISKAVAHAKNDQLTRLSVMAMIEVVQTQDMDCYPPKAIKFLLEVKELPLLLAEFSKDYDAHKFIALFAGSLAENCVSDKYHLNIFCDIIALLPLDREIKVLVSKMITAGLDREARDKKFSSRETFRKVLLAIEKHFPAELDTYISALFEEQNDRFIEVVNDVLKDSLRKPLEGSNCNLYSSIDHPEAEIRKAAVKRISELCQKPLNPEAAHFVQESLLRRLGDDDFAVVRMVLLIDGLVNIVPPGKLLKLLADLIHKCMGVLETGPKSLRADAKEIVKMCLKILESSFTKKDAGSMKKMQGCLVCYLLIKPKTWKLNLHFLRVSALHPVFLFKDLSKEQVGDAKELLKDKQRAEINDRIVAALATAIIEQPSAVDVLLEAASHSSNAQLLGVLVISKCFSGDQKEELRELSEKCLPFIEQEWQSIVADPKLQLSKLSKINYEYQLGQDDLYQRLEHGEVEVYAEVILRSLYRMIPCLTSWNETIFLLFSGSSNWELFKAHIIRFLEPRANSVAFLLEFAFATRKEISAPMQVHNFSILAWYCSQQFVQDEERLQLAVVGSFVALSNPLKSVRTAALSCIKAIKNKFKIPKPILRLLQVVVESDENFINDSKFLSSFCKTFFAKEESRRTVSCLVENVLHLPVPVQTALFGVLHGVGYTNEKASATQNALFNLLQRRRLYHLTTSASSQFGLGEPEVELVDKLLEINIENVLLAAKGKDTGNNSKHILWALFEALDVDGGALADPVVVRPCMLALRSLASELYSQLDTKSQDTTFKHLIVLAAVPDDKVGPAARETLDKIEVSVATISSHIGLLYSLPDPETSNKRVKRMEDQNQTEWPTEGKTASVSIEILEFLVRRTRVNPWKGLLSQLFDLLRAHLKGQWPKRRTEISEGNMQYIGQLAMTSIENILRSSSEIPKDDLDVNLLVQYMKEATHAATRNHALAVITAAGRLHPESVLPHVVEMVSVVGASSVTEDDSHSHMVVQDLLSAVVPFWLTKMNNPQTLLQVFLEALPTIPPHRQTDLVKCVLRVTNEETSISAFLMLLLKHNVNLFGNQTEPKQWPVTFADKLCMSYDAKRRVSALVRLSSEFQTPGGDQSFWSILQLAMRFIAAQLQTLDLQLLENDATIQDACRTLMEHALQKLQLISDKKMKLSSESRALYLGEAHVLLDSVTRLMSPSVFCKSVACLLKDSDDGIRRKVLQMYVSKLKQHDAATKKKSFERNFTVDSEAHMEIVIQISKLLESPEQNISSRTKQAAVSALDITAQKFGDRCASVFVSCLPAVLTNFEAASKPLVVASIRCSASILSTAGPEALPNLPALMNKLLKIAQQHAEELADDDVDFVSSLLLTLEAAVEKLGTFLSPYIKDMIRVVMSPAYNKFASMNLSTRLASVRMLISERIPARLLLDPLVASYKHAVETSETATAIIFEMLAVMCSKLDRASVAAYHGKVFDFCMGALDLRRKQPKSFTSVHVVEEHVLSAFSALVMKLSETTFRPLFVAVQEWASPTVLDGEVAGQSIERTIVFYKLVNHLTNKLRSVFVPYFRYLLDGCLVLLGKTEGSKSSKSKKRKKLQLHDNVSALQRWHLKQLVISALHKCFLYDTIGFLDAAKFQQLLEPLANQLLDEAPAEVEGLRQPDVPKLVEADEALVSCLGRMALTAGTDTLWKPLNHEVLMKTRSDSVRAKRLALDIVRFLAENLREEYLVLIPETIPFLSELLESQDLAIVGKTQEVIKMLEELSGESLAQYM